MLITLTIILFVVACIGTNRHIKTQIGARALLAGLITAILVFFLVGAGGLAIRGGAVRIDASAIALLCGCIVFQFTTYLGS